VEIESNQHPESQADILDDSHVALVNERLVILVGESSISSWVR
jgi:hypothetical protein